MKYIIYKSGKRVKTFTREGDAIHWMKNQKDYKRGYYYVSFEENT